MVNETILAVIIAFAVSAALCPIVIPFLHKLKFGQQVREDGPQAHLKKQGTPTMGGLIILSSIVITSLFYMKDYPRIIPVLFMTVGFGIIGFLDDYIKIVMKRSEGLNPKQKLLGQIVITGIFAYYLMTSGEVGTEMLIPFTGGLRFLWWRSMTVMQTARIFPGSGVALCTGPVLYRPWNGQRRQFHRRSGRTLHKCDDPGGHFFYRGGSGRGERHQPHHGRRCGKSSGLPLI